VSAANLSRAIGLTAWLQTPEGFALEAQITDAKNSYGTVRYFLVAKSFYKLAEGKQDPNVGAWVNADRVLIATPNGLTRGTTFSQGDK
jgi:hypothetical protein